MCNTSLLVHFTRKLEDLTLSSLTMVIRKALHSCLRREESGALLEEWEGTSLRLDWMVSMTKYIFGIGSLDIGSGPQVATSVATDIGDPLAANTNGICCRVLQFRTCLSPLDGSIYTVRLGQSEARTLLRKRWVRVVGSRPSLNDGVHLKDQEVAGGVNQEFACLSPIHMVNSRSWKLHQYWKLEQLIRRGFVPSNLEASIISDLYYYLVLLRLSSLGLIVVLLGHDHAGFVVSERRLQNRLHQRDRISSLSSLVVPRGGALFNVLLNRSFPPVFLNQRLYGPYRSISSSSFFLRLLLFSFLPIFRKAPLFPEIRDSCWTWREL
ncbi:hypothetical protein VNO77_19138 [Canavalia gladiata]|uniref:Uncharacterized protein n=1 Tax=Canavalia gladiata TaxID=3824 RepID=A0AAN9QL37_CANGL